MDQWIGTAYITYVQPQSFTLNYAELLSNVPLGKNFSGIFIKT